ncbi:MAG TPA: hypothetical protein VNR62_13430, partial [Cellulomonas sp.]|nr:hypothetical protein [Cellulomonas sp.]
MDTVPTTGTEARAPRRRKVRAVQLTLAGLALVGIGAAATSAAWTDDAWFSSNASSAKILLDASATSSTGPWSAADDDPGVTFGGSTFALLVPGQTRTATYWVKNNSTSCLNVPAPTVTKAEPLAGTSTTTDAAVTLSTTAIGNMAPGAVQSVTVTVSTPTNWASSHQNQTSATALKIRYTGTTVVG